MTHNTTQPQIRYFWRFMDDSVPFGSVRFRWQFRSVPFGSVGSSVRFRSVPLAVPFGSVRFRWQFRSVPFMAGSVCCLTDLEVRLSCD